VGKYICGEKITIADFCLAALYQKIMKEENNSNIIVSSIQLHDYWKQLEFSILTKSYLTEAINKPPNITLPA
jgi:hypothetical protein